MDTVELAVIADEQPGHWDGEQYSLQPCGSIFVNFKGIFIVSADLFVRNLINQDD